MAQVTLQSHCVLISVKVFAVVATEASGGIFVAYIVRVTVPIRILFREDTLLVSSLQCGDSCLDLALVGYVIIWIISLIIRSQAGNPIHSHSSRIVNIAIHLV